MVITFFRGDPMKVPINPRFLIATFISIVLLFPRLSAAIDLIVEHSPTDPTHFYSIQAAIDYAGSQLSGTPPGTSTFRIIVTADPNPYYESFIPISNVPIIGSETSRTYLDQFNLGPLISLNNVTNVTIRNFTIYSKEVGIAVTNSSAITIANNIFRVGSGGTALQVQGSPSTAIVNNTFYQSGTALSINTDSLITNNIFAGNSTAIATTTNLSRLTYNTYHNNGTNGAITLDANSLPNSSVTNPGPLFVDPANNDFHLQSGSPCHSYGGVNAGNPGYPNADNPAFFDMGAYGGPDSDTIPFRILGLTATGGVAADAVALSWKLNMGYQVNGYHLYYGTTSGDRHGTGATEGNSPLTIAQGVNSATLSNLPLVTPATPAAVTGVALIPANEALFVSWTPAVNATGYKVYYSTTSFSAASLPATFKRVNGANASGVTLLGLTNGVNYYVAVAAIAQPTYFLTVTAFNAGGGTPGVSNESSYAPEVAQYLGTARESALSNIMSAMPAVQPISIGWGDGVWGGGAAACFIATAAYGHYSAPQVQTLRDFRDRYLLTNPPGRAFVGWYYRYGPIGAAFINAHPWCKPLVRLLLLPLIGAAMFLLHTSVLTKGIVMAGILLVAGSILWRKRRGTKGYVFFKAETDRYRLKSKRLH